MHSIYLDHNATTRPADEVVSAMVEALCGCWANPSSVHRPGQAARRHVALAREAIVALLGCQDRELVLTSGGTEADNLALRGTLAALPQRRVLITSRLEHAAVAQQAEALQAGRAEVLWLANDGDGLVDLPALQGALEARGGEIALVSIMWVNNETGVIQPVERIGELCRKHGVLFHTDATQAVGKMPLDLAGLPVDLASFAAHKFHGPKGIGGLYVRRGVRLEPIIVGGPHEGHRRGGTENVPGIAGLGAAARLAAQWLATDGPARMTRLREHFERALAERVGGVTFNGAGAPRLWSTSNVAFEGLEAEPILLMLSERGVCASAGAACASGALEPSHVLLAMGMPPARAAASVRFSFARDTTRQEVDQALAVIGEVVAALRGATATARN